MFGFPVFCLFSVEIYVFQQQFWVIIIFDGVPFYPFYFTRHVTSWMVFFVESKLMVSVLMSLFTQQLNFLDAFEMQL